jgi:hypothetical protein
MYSTMQAPTDGKKAAVSAGQADSAGGLNGEAIVYRRTRKTCNRLLQVVGQHTKGETKGKPKQRDDELSNSVHHRFLQSLRVCTRPPTFE